MEFILNNLEALFVIVIFAISIIGSLFNKKNRPAGTEAEEEAEEAPPPAPAHRAPHRQPANLDEEMRRTLEDIFAAKQQPPESQRTSHSGRRDARSYDSRKNVAVSVRSNSQPQAAGRIVKPARSIDEEWQNAIMDREQRDAFKTAGAVSAFDVPEQQSTPHNDYALLAQARSGIVWSEILQPPVSMR